MAVQEPYEAHKKEPSTKSFIIATWLPPAILAGLALFTRLATQGVGGMDGLGYGVLFVFGIGLAAVHLLIAGIAGLVKGRGDGADGQARSTTAFFALAVAIVGLLYVGSLLSIF